MSLVQFEENNDLDTQSLTFRKPQSRLVSFLIEKKLAKNESQATTLLIGIIIVIILISAFLFIRTKTEDEIDFKHRPVLPQNS